MLYLRLLVTALILLVLFSVLVGQTSFIIRTSIKVGENYITNVEYRNEKFKIR